jgi:hypothetical protein
VTIIPVLLILAGIVLWKFTRRAAFNRRNEYGVEVFNSYGHMQGRRFIEKTLRFGAVILVLVGIGHAIAPHQGSSSAAPVETSHPKK